MVLADEISLEDELAQGENLGVPAFGDKNVGGLDVAMDDAFRVRGLERVGDLNREGENGLGFERTVADLVLQRGAFQVLHSDKRFAVVFANVVNGADVRMVQRRGNFGFAAKPLERLWVGRQRVRQKLQSHEVVQPDVLRLVHDTHAPAAEAFQDAAKPRQRTQKFRRPGRSQSSRNLESVRDSHP
jgi:hypothetical protein